MLMHQFDKTFGRYQYIVQFETMHGNPFVVDAIWNNKQTLKRKVVK